MATWIRCLDYKDQDSSVWVNLDNVAYLRGSDDHGVFVFRDGFELVVAESPANILAFQKVTEGA